MAWYVVRTKPQHEIKSAKVLKDLGLEVYCPVITEVRQWSDRKRKVTLPLFRTYIFADLDAKNRNRVYEAPGVLGFLNCLGKPAVARPQEIEAINSWLNNDRLDGFEVGKLSAGDKVEIKTGQFAKKEAIIREVGNRKLKLILPEIGWTLTANIQDVV